MELGQLGQLFFDVSVGLEDSTAPYCLLVPDLGEGWRVEGGG